MATSITETERKYEAAPGAGLPDLARLPGVAGTSSPGEQQLEAEYFDTPDLRLLRAGITLRRRRGGSDAGWHLKLPTGTDTRQEIRLPLGQSGRRVPADLASLVRAHTRGEPLGLVARIATRRQPLILLGRSGESLAEVAADDVTAEAPGDPLRVSRWQEVEVELTGGGRRLLDAAGKALRQAGLRPAARAAKLERALDREPRERAGPRKLTPASPAGEVVLAYLREQARTLLSLDPLVRRDEPDSVHQMRVAARRLRSTLRSFGKVLRRGDTERLGTARCSPGTWLPPCTGPRQS
jgi:inorganic triphosphatase YgiF